MTVNERRKYLRRMQKRYLQADRDDALRVIAESFDYVCAERLTPNLVWMVEHLATHDEIVLTPHLREKLARISLSTVRRRLKRINQDQPRLPRNRETGCTCMITDCCS